MQRALALSRSTALEEEEQRQLRLAIDASLGYSIPTVPPASSASLGSTADGGAHIHSSSYGGGYNPHNTSAAYITPLAPPAAAQAHARSASVGYPGVYPPAQQQWQEPHSHSAAFSRSVSTGAASSDGRPYVPPRPLSRTNTDRSLGSSPPSVHEQPPAYTPSAKEASFQSLPSRGYDPGMAPPPAYGYDPHGDPAAPYIPAPSSLVSSAIMSEDVLYPSLDDDSQAPLYPAAAAGSSSSGSRQPPPPVPPKPKPRPPPNGRR